MPEGRRKQKTVDLPELDLEHDFEIRLKRANEQLRILREQEELLDRERKELEGLKMQTEELEADKKEIDGKLTAALAVLAEEEQETMERQQEVISTRKEIEILIKEMHFAERRGQKVEDIPRKIAIEREVVDRATEVFERARKQLGLFSEAKIPEEEEELEYTRPVFSLFEGFKVGLGFFLAGALLSSILYILYLMLRQ